MNYRNRRLLDLARGQPCMMCVPGVCRGDPATTVAAHSNQDRHGKGRSLKAHDCFHAWACYECHTWLDQGRAPREEKQAAFQAGMERTILAWFTLGLVRVA